MKEKRGFTLIELLAVIVILAVIALIATPLIMGTIEKAKVNAYKDTIYGMIKAGENYIAEELLNGEYPGETLDLSKENKLNYKGTKPTKGSMTLLPSGSISLAIQNGKYCYMKKTNQNEVEVTTSAKECSIRVANNLIKNGYGEYQDNTNFEAFDYADGIFSRSSNKRTDIVGKELIPIDSNKAYRLKATMKTNQPNTIYYMGINEYDADKNKIGAFQVKYIDNTLTTLKSDLKNGDTVVYLDDVSNWLLQEYNPGTVDTNVNKGLIFWNYKDSTGYQYKPLTYSRNVWLGLYEFQQVDKTNHTITLKNPWDHGTIKAGTKLSQSMSGGTYNYGLLRSSTTVATEFTTYQTTISGVQTENGGFTAAFDNTKFRPGTEYVSFVMIDNFNKQANVKTELKDIVLEEVAK